jgi:hypothetical protein
MKFDTGAFTVILYFGPCRLSFRLYNVNGHFAWRLICRSVRNSSEISLIFIRKYAAEENKTHTFTSSTYSSSFMAFGISK